MVWCSITSQYSSLGWGDLFYGIQRLLFLRLMYEEHLPVRPEGALENLRAPKAVF